MKLLVSLIIKYNLLISIDSFSSRAEKLVNNLSIEEVLDKIESIIMHSCG